jgi:short-subunit dehydrogenase
LDTPVEVYEREVQLNYLGSLYTVKSALPSLIKSKGHLVIVSSAIVFNSFIGYSNYSATKMALKGLADSLRNELQLYDIGVTLFAPANIDTEGFVEENKTKPKETKEIEGASPAQNPNITADYLIKGLKDVRTERTFS